MPYFNKPLILIQAPPTPEELRHAEGERTSTLQSDEPGVTSRGVYVANVVNPQSRMRTQQATSFDVINASFDVENVFE